MVEDYTCKSDGDRIRDLEKQVRELKSLLKKCYTMIPDELYLGQDLIDVKSGLTKYDCWPD